ncbi:lipopolysaccharide kinase InaA family protein [Spartinivicinus poritis]|uniref:Protein kinase domain-containing protein n=1 Tax=Spartinivicinus poritis TaxID=2994640 RepID=A0ABT5U6D9_9GAMM|nr:lipopolysaccharide kinase InaA family protein [Spartinivicinus sp. A2-2]MDE1461934.1 hypothetical protein [Spartinivicinus sp. A2-2]
MAVAIPQATLAGLRSQGREVTTPFSLLLDNEQVELVVHKTLRVLPGKRVVGYGEYQGQPVLAKLFVAPNKAKWHAQRELKGTRWLEDAGVATQQLVASDTFEQQGHVVLFKWLDNTQSLAELWQQASSDEQRLQLFLPSFGLLAQMHKAGLKQDDIHLNNFLVYQGNMLAIDGDGVDGSLQGSLLPRQDILDNLAIYLAQLPPYYDRFVSQVVADYNARQLEMQPMTEVELQALTVRWRKWRVANYLRKVTRDCSEFVVNKSWSRLEIYRREWGCDEWHGFLQNLDYCLVDNSNRLKSGNTATVGMAQYNGQPLVIKRYNIKSVQHRLSRCWRPSRAWVSWLNAHRLGLLGIQTPQPIALIEERCGPLRGRAFLILEYVAGPDCLSHFLAATDSSEVERWLPAFSQLFETMEKYQISHGDLKANNLLLAESGLQMIDLDAMQQHDRPGSFQVAFQRDLQRFNKNWLNASPNIKQVFEQLVSRFS